MVALPALGWMRAYEAQPYQGTSRPAPSGKKLAVILQGPFAVVLRKSKGYRVTAFVPKTAPDDPARHEFRFLNPLEEPLGPCSASYQFELLPNGLQATAGVPEIDPGFTNVEFSVNRWVPKPEEYFVMLDLPKPDDITYIPPLYPALFDSGHDTGGRSDRDSENMYGARLGSAPMNHVLEYTLRDGDDVRLRQKQVENCGKAHDYPAVPHKKMLEEYERYQKSMPDQAEDPSLSQRPHFSRWMEAYSYIYFLGVGLHPYTGKGPFPQGEINARVTHGIRFFNERLLPAIYQGQPIPPGSKLVKLGMDALPCGPSQHLKPGAWNDSFSQPRLLTVASTENCAAPGVTGTAFGP
jgi:hypothetical protein